MSSLIKIDDVLECIEDAQDGSKKTYDILADVFNRVLALPSAEAVQGEWIFEPKDAIELMFTKPKCSECGFESADGGNFCSNCGAKMTKGGEEDE